jgi:hypothetical protein
MAHTLSHEACPSCLDLTGCKLPTKLRDDQLDLEEFWHVFSAWSQATFGNDASRGPRGPLLHLQKEVAECLEDPMDVEEYADCVFLVFDACRRAGFSFNDLRIAINRKLKTNMARRWPSPTSDQPVEPGDTGHRPVAAGEGKPIPPQGGSGTAPPQGKRKGKAGLFEPANDGPYANGA